MMMAVMGKSYCYSYLIFSFLALLLLFYLSEFSVHSYQPHISTIKLIQNTSEIQIRKKVILIIIDSLRYDYQSKLPFIHNTMQRYPLKTYIAKCKVGNPTMTTQRVQSLMVGSQIFSSANILKSFFASKIQADNIIAQLNRNNKTSMVLGDDTWVKLYDVTASRVCTNTYNVHDLQSCDQPIYKHMTQEMRMNHYDLMIAHFLSVDHVGHSTSSISNQLMSDKLLNISNFIEQVIGQMDQESILFVSGDHGMKEDGNHGGNTYEQQNTLFFAYNTKHPFIPHTNRQISQADITTTLSIYLDIPLPSNAVGLPIIQVLPIMLSESQQLSRGLLVRLREHFQKLLSFYKIQVNSRIDIEHLGLAQSLRYFKQYNEKIQFLKYSSPNSSLNLIILFSITIVTILVTICIYTLQQFIGDSTASKLNKLMLISTLFIVYFSWNLIQNLTNIFSIVLTASIILLYCQNNQLRQARFKLFCTLLGVFMIWQAERSNDRQQWINWFKLHIFTYVYSTFAFKCIALIVIALQVFKNGMPSNAQACQKITFIFSSIVYLLTYLSHLPHSLQSLLYHCRKAIILTLLCLSIKTIYNKANYRTMGLLWTSTISLMLFGQFAPLIYACSYYMVVVTVELKGSALLVSFLGEAIWWWMGNRFQYSGVDILKSYILSEEYHPLVNGVTLFIYICAPQLVLFSNYNIIAINNPINQSPPPEILQEERQKLAEDQTGNAKNYKNTSLTLVQLNRYFIVIPLVALLSCIWNVDYNNQKILFTVVYVPMFLFSLTKLTAALTMVGLANLILSNQ